MRGCRKKLWPKSRKRPPRSNRADHMSASSATVTGARPSGRVSFIQRLRGGDEVAYAITFACAASVVLITLLLVFELYQRSGTSRRAFGLSFLATSIWDPVAGRFGALPFIYGTVVTSLLALLIAIPLGVGAAIFLAELAPPKISDALTFCIELLAAVPSVIFGLLGIFILVPILRSVEPALRGALGWAPLFQGPF